MLVCDAIFSPFSTAGIPAGEQEGPDGQEDGVADEAVLRAIRPFGSPRIR